MGVVVMKDPSRLVAEKLATSVEHALRSGYWSDYARRTPSDRSRDWYAGFLTGSPNDSGPSRVVGVRSPSQVQEGTAEVETTIWALDRPNSDVARSSFFRVLGR